MLIPLAAAFRPVNAHLDQPSHLEGLRDAPKTEDPIGSSGAAIDATNVFILALFNNLLCLLGQSPHDTAKQVFQSGSLR
jgi:hypothetical protein